MVSRFTDYSNGTVLECYSGVIKHAWIPRNSHLAWFYGPLWGYFDPAHMIRDFREFAGLRTSEYFADR